MSFVSRRRLLGAGGAVVALPFLESLVSREARAQMMGTAAPRRLLWVFTPNGDQESRRFDTRHETNFVLGEFLKPYESQRADMLFLEGVNKYHWRLPQGQRADGHQQGGSALAPWKSGSGSFPIGGQAGQTIGYVLGPSIDRVIGERVQAANSNVKFTHFNFRVGDRQNHIWNQHSHRGPTGTQNPIPPETDPFAAYTRIFASVDPAARDSALRRLRMRQSALDTVKTELADLRPKLSTDDQRRLDQHGESVREIERSLSGMASNVPQCTTFAAGAKVDAFSEDKWWDIGRVFSKIIAMSFACDLTRTVNFNWSGNTSDRKYRELGHTDGHHTISHDSSAGAFDRIRQINRLLHQRTMDGIYTELKAIKEGDGSSVYDNTLVMHWSELSQGDTHGNSNNLVMFGGGAKKIFRTGRWVSLNSQRNSFSDLLVYCFHFMGYTDVMSFGDPLLSQGGLPQGLT